MKNKIQRNPRLCCWNLPISVCQMLDLPSLSNYAGQSLLVQTQSFPAENSLSFAQKICNCNSCRHLPNFAAISKTQIPHFFWLSSWIPIFRWVFVWPFVGPDWFHFASHPAFACRLCRKAASTRSSSEVTSSWAAKGWSVMEIFMDWK